jgi:hypothetical protein
MKDGDTAYKDGTYAWVQARIKKKSMAWITLRSDEFTGEWELLNQAIELGIKALEEKQR